jgi:MEDS: MEthanogen/methylotroph, DcmR Sensory domain
MLSEIEASAETHRHLVQFYGPNNLPLVRNVGAYLARGLSGGGAIVIAGAAHRQAFRARVAASGIDAAAAIEAGRLSLLDAEETLDRFMVAGEPHHGRFDDAVGRPVRAMHAEWGAGGVRGFGEMVGLLWQRGNRTGAIQLERYWNELLAVYRFSLYCAYPVDVLNAAFKPEDLDGVLTSHTHVIDTGAPGELGNAVMRALEETLGARADGLKQLMRSKNFRTAWAELPEGEATVLWLRRNLPDQADPVLARARQYFN